MAMTIVTSRSSKPLIWSKNCARKKVAFEELILPEEIHGLLRWSDWVRAYRAADFLDRKLAAPNQRR
jgi:hypothetical protein